MIKLAMIPDRPPLKLTIAAPPDLMAYAEFYRQTYGREEPIAELVPAMVAAFLASNRAFIQSRKGSGSR